MASWHTYPRNCQTFRAPPAEPGELLSGLASRLALQSRVATFVHLLASAFGPQEKADHVRIPGAIGGAAEVSRRLSIRRE